MSRPLRIHTQTDEYVALMNARKKEKKRVITLGQKPKNIAEWDNLCQEMKQWYAENTFSDSIYDFPTFKRYPAHSFVKWGKDRETPDCFREALEFINYLVLQRRTENMRKEEKLFMFYMKQLPLYDWALKEMEDERANKELLKAVLAQKDFPNAIIVPVEKTEKLDKFLEEKKVKNENASLG